MAARAEDRHATARALAGDIERWAADEPTLAWREPFSIRARRWMRRNRTLVTAASVALIAALFGTMAVLAVQTRANAALKKSNEALNMANARVTNSVVSVRPTNLTNSRWPRRSGKTIGRSWSRCPAAYAVYVP